MRSIIRGTALILVGCAALRGATAASTPTVHVPGDFATIQQAVDAIGSDGIIEVAAGDYGPVKIGWTLPGSTNASSVSNVTIHGTSDAVIDGGAKPAITVTAGSRIVIDGVTVISRDVGVLLHDGSDITVQNVTIQSAGSDGIRAGGVTDLTITGNLVESAGSAGIRAEDVTDVVVTGNRVESAGGTAISVRAMPSESFGPLTVTSNTVLAAVGDGIFLLDNGDTADITVTDNVVTNVDARGIAIFCGMALDLSRNDVRTTGEGALWIGNVHDRVSVAENTVLDAGGAGIEVCGTPNVDVLDNSIVGTVGDGVTVSALDVEINGNSVTGAGDAGIRVSYANEQYSPAYGIPDPVTSIGLNVVTQPAGTGIVLDHARPVDVGGNTITEPGVHGIELDGTHGARVFLNEVTGAGSCGFRLEHGARGNVLTDNTAVDCSPSLWARGLTKKNRIGRSNRFGRRHDRR